MVVLVLGHIVLMDHVKDVIVLHCLGETMEPFPLKLRFLGIS